MKQTRKLEKLLKEYIGGLKSFDADELNEASYTYAVRKILEENKKLLSQVQLNELKKADNQAVSLWKNFKEKQKDGLLYLELIVKNFIFNSSKVSAKKVA